MVGGGYFCGEWDPVTPSGLTVDALDDDGSDCTAPAASISYLVRPSGHELWALTPAGPMRARSPDGTTFTWFDAPPGRELGPISYFTVGDVIGRMRPASIGSVIPGLVFEVSTNDGLAWAPIGGTSPGILPATGLPATFDSDATVAGTVVEASDGPRIVYAARGDFVPRASDGHGYASIGTARLVLEAN